MWHRNALPLVWCPKYRRKVLQGTIAERLKELIIQHCSEINADIIEMEIMPDHVHLLNEVDPQFGINQAVRSVSACDPCKQNGAKTTRAALLFRPRLATHVKQNGAKTSYAKHMFPHYDSTNSV